MISSNPLIPEMQIPHFCGIMLQMCPADLDKGALEIRKEAE